MEAEEERRWQPVRTPASPAFDMAKWKQQDYAESARWEQRQAYQRYRQGEWAEPQPQKKSSGSSLSRPWWQRTIDKVTDGLITLGQKSPLARNVLLKASSAWFNRVQPIVNTAFDFIGGFSTQVVRNNLDALTLIAPVPPKVKQNYFQGWEAFDSRQSTAYRVGQFVGSLVGIAQGMWEMGSGIATATGGTVLSCGTVVLCFAGGGAAVVAGGAVAVHGALVTSVSLVNTIYAGRALFAAQSGGSGLRVGDTLPDHPEAKIVDSRTPVGPARDYEARVLNKPDPNVEIEVNGVKVDWYEGDTLLDAKHAGETGSWYDLSKTDRFTQRVKVSDVRSQLERQLNALEGSSFERIEWRVADPLVRDVLENFIANDHRLKEAFEAGKIIVTYAP